LNIQDNPAVVAAYEKLSAEIDSSATANARCPPWYDARRVSDLFQLDEGKSELRSWKDESTTDTITTPSNCPATSDKATADCETASPGQQRLLEEWSGGGDDADAGWVVL
jgi:hypothetical protein